MLLIHPTLYIGVLVILSNFAFHLLGLEKLMSPFGLHAYQTFFSSISFLCLFLSFHKKLYSLKFSLLQVALIFQVVSVLFLLLKIEISSLYFLSSSLPTSLFIITMVLAIYIMEKMRHQISQLHTIFSLFFILYSFVMLFAFLTKNLYILGISKQLVGVGVSFYTTLCFMSLTTLYHLKYCSTIKLKPLQVTFHPRSSYLILIAFSILNFLLIFCTGNSKVITALGVQVIFIIVTYFVYLAPFQNQGKKPVVVCAWSNQVKISKAQEKAWGSINDLYNQIGLDVSHGISPDVKKKIKNKKQKAKPT